MSARRNADRVCARVRVAGINHLAGLCQTVGRPVFTLDDRRGDRRSVVYLSGRAYRKRLSRKIARTFSDAGRRNSAAVYRISPAVLVHGSDPRFAVCIENYFIILAFGREEVGGIRAAHFVFPAAREYTHGGCSDNYRMSVCDRTGDSQIH